MWKRRAFLDRRCGGTGWLDCHCGGDVCVCVLYGGVECDGCEDCESHDDTDHPDTRRTAGEDANGE